MASASLGNGGVGSSRSVNGFKSSSSSVDWLGREMLEMRLRDKVDHDEDRVRILHVFIVSPMEFLHGQLWNSSSSSQDSEPDVIDGVGAEAGHVIRTTIGGRNGQSRQVRIKLISRTYKKIEIC